MKKEEIDEWERHEYKEKCSKCGRELVCLTQRDFDPEYYTAVYVKCECGEYVYFSLPVN